MAGGIYLVQDGGGLVELAEQPYEAEAVLQRLLADYPNLLAGDQVDPASPRRWLFVAREAGVPGEEGGASRWSLDHLFLDQDAIPTLVEVKRSSDTRVRREVVGQMLDYAANAVIYWPPEAIRAQFETRCAANGQEPADVLAAFLGEEDTEVFWQAAKQNLQSGRVRMVFVADVIPPELRRIVEFLNDQMDRAEVLALEVRQFMGQGLTALVPKIVGQTAAAQQAKAVTRTPGKRQWDEASFFADLEARRGPDEVAVARAILDWARRSELRIWWGKGEKVGSFYPMLDHAGGLDWTVSVWSSGSIEVQFQQLARAHADTDRHPFVDEAKRLELLRHLNDVPGVSIPETAIARRPNIPLAVLVKPNALDAFLKVLDWLVAEVRASAAEPA